MIHEELVKRGAKWLKNNYNSRYRFPIILPEYRCYSNSIPDVIGMSHWSTIVIECKATRADFLADSRKGHRRYVIQLGNERYYLVPAGLVLVEEVPEKWGLLYCYDHKITVEKEAVVFPPSETRPQEYQVMYSLIRRLVSLDGHDKTLELLKTGAMK